MASNDSFFGKLAAVFRTIFWVLLIVILAGQWYAPSSLEKRRQAAVEAFQSARGSRVITLIHRQETVSLFGVPVDSYITIDDADAILRAIRLTPPEKPIDLILHTPGGLVLAASQVAHALAARKGKVTVFVPHYAMSGGTLISLAASEIVMDPNAVLGPVDPQIGGLPAASIVRAVEAKTPAHVEDQTLILADVSAKAINQVASMVTGLLAKHLPQAKAKELAGLLSTGQFTHDFPFTVERAKSIGLPVVTTMPDAVYRIMDLYPQGGGTGSAVEYFPLGKGKPAGKPVN